jgi:hypothetical protein
MAVTRINNNQISDAVAGNIYVGVNAASKLQDYSITSQKITNSLTYGSDLTITGNLTVNGQTTTIDTVSTVIEDPVIVLASNQTGTPAVDIGFIGERGDQNNIAFVWDESADEFVTAFTTDLVTNTTVTISSYANFHTNDANIGGNLAVGGNISITGNVTSLNVTGNITGGNLLTPGVVTATGNVSGGNVVTAGQVSATGNITGGNVTTAGITDTGSLTASTTINATGNITGGNLSAGSGIISTTGNINGGNVNATAGITAGTTINATGNVTGGNLTTAGVTSTGSLTASTTINATGNITGGNVTTAGITNTGSLTASTTINATGNITGGNVSAGSGIISTTGNINGGNVNATSGITAGTTINATGNITGGNVTTAGITDTGSLTASTTINATGNITGGNVTTAGITSTGSLTASTTINATGNITGGNLTTAGQVVATGNVSGGNVNTAGAVTATGNVIGGNVVTSTVTGGASTLTLNATGDVVFAQSGNINATGSYINNLSDPAQAQDAATKQYVDDAVSTGITIHPPVRLEAPVDIGGTYAQGGTTATVTDTIAGNTVVFSSAISPQVNDQLWFSNSFNGIVANTPYFVVSAPNTSAAILSATYSGVPVSNITGGTGLTQGVRINSGQGATLTNNGANVTLVIDGVTVANTNRILVYHQANAVHNGVYVVSNAGNATSAWQLTRSSDMDTYIPDDINGLDAGDYFYVQEGDTGAGESYVMTAPIGPTIIGFANLTFTQFSASQVYTANTSAGLNLTGTVFSAKVDNNTTAFDGGGNIIVKASANLTTPNIGAATGTSLNVTGNIDSGNLNTGGQVVATGNITGGNVTTTGITSTGSLTASTTITATGNVSGGNLTTAGQVAATGNVSGGNVNATSGITAGTTISATGNVSGGNLTTSGQVAATGNVSGGNINTAGTINATGNVNGTGAVFSGNVTAQNFIGNISGNIDAGGANTNIQFNDGDILAGSAAFTFDKVSNAVVATGNITGGNIGTAGQVTATGNVTGGNLLTAGLISAGTTITATGNITGGNVTTGGQVTATGNVNGGNIVATALVTGANVTATANVTGANVVGTTSGKFGNIVISGDDITDTNGRVNINTAGADVDFAVNGDTVANIFYVDAGTGTASFGTSTQTTNAIVAFNTPTSVLMPVGNTAQRPGVGVTGMLRFNSTTDSLEIYDNSEWTAVGVPSFTVIDDQQFNGNGSQVNFTINSNQTTNSCIVSINGVVQIPTIAYSVSGTTLTFTEAPESGDIIDVRQLTTTTSVTSISNSSGNAIIQVSDTTNDVSITGDLIPTGNVTQDLGSPTARWRDGYFSGSSLILGNVVMKNVPGGNSIAFFGPDGTTPATIAASSVDTTQIASGTSSMAVIASGGNIRANVAGSTVQTISAGLVAITGDLSVTGNATLSGNILGDRVQNGTTSFDIQTPSGNANITVGATSNVAVFTATGANITGTLGVTGAVTGASLSVSTGNISGGNLILSGAIEDSAQLDIRTTASNGNIVLTPNGSGVVVMAKDIVNGQANGVGNIGSATGFFNTVFAKATSAQYADLAEKYIADAEYTPGTVVAFGGDKEVTVTSTDADRAVAGVVSTNPSYIMNAGLEAEHVATVALTGRVPCRVTGTVRKGDLMVSAGYGLARAEADPRVGTVIGKALENFEGTEGVIEVVVGRF